ncbi:hypothetical protein V1687_18255 [Pseudomonas putida]|uniref:hypothetical protein n=1 Tax=Pseudomonas putida TaxID=303 RepID=UPI002ED56666|nr:hypothetical protein V1687_18255 [Pseudomonas putida]
MPRLIYGVGVRDLPYQIAGQDGSPQRDPCYAKWSDMLMRCYSTKYKSKYPSYQECSVATEWHTFSVFRAWMTSQNWQGMVLDKDLQEPGCQLYGPETCLFIPGWLNAFLSSFSSKRLSLPMGVSPEGERFIARYGAKSEQIRLGLFDTAEAAHAAYRKYRLTKLEEKFARYVDIGMADQKVVEALHRLIISEQSAIRSAA